MYLPEDDDYREAESAVAGAAICVFEGYVPDCPGTMRIPVKTITSSGRRRSSRPVHDDRLVRGLTILQQDDAGDEIIQLTGVR